MDFLSIENLKWILLVTICLLAIPLILSLFHIFAYKKLEKAQAALSFSIWLTSISICTFSYIAVITIFK